jgi:hypothetical protein
VESAGFITNGRLLPLNSYENRVYQVGVEEGRPVVTKFYRPGRWSDAAILEEHAFALELAEREIPVVAPLVVDGRTLLESGDALALERLLLNAVWEHLDRASEGHYFDFEAVLIYSMRWDLVARWTAYRGEAAVTRFDEMVQDGLQDVLPQPGVLPGVFADGRVPGG